jgi:hypothetical protein
MQNEKTWSFGLKGEKETSLACPKGSEVIANFSPRITGKGSQELCLYLERNKI